MLREALGYYHHRTGRWLYIAALIVFPVAFSLAVLWKAGRLPPGWREWLLISVWVVGIFVLNWPSRWKEGRK